MMLMNHLEIDSDISEFFNQVTPILFKLFSFVTNKFALRLNLIFILNVRKKSTVSVCTFNQRSEHVRESRNYRE